MKFTKEQKNAIKRVCADYDFEDLKELKAWFKDFYGDDFCPEWFENDVEEDCYKEMAQWIEMSIA